MAAWSRRRSRTPARWPHPPTVRVRPAEDRPEPHAREDEQRGDDEGGARRTRRLQTVGLRCAYLRQPYRLRPVRRVPAGRSAVLGCRRPSRMPGDVGAVCRGHRGATMDRTIEVLDDDFFATPEERQVDPYPFYERLRALPEGIGRSATFGSWHTATHAHVRALLVDPRLTSNPAFASNAAELGRGSRRGGQPRPQPAERPALHGPPGSHQDPSPRLDGLHPTCRAAPRGRHRRDRRRVARRARGRSRLR